MINFYRDIWKRRAHILAPLNEIQGCNPKQFSKLWGPRQDEAFEQSKAMLAPQDTLLRYPDPNKAFVIEPNASDEQLRAVIKQDDKPVAFFSRKLTAAQKKYPAVDKEALCIAQVLSEYRAMLKGTDLTIKTDHRNLVEDTISSHRLLHWQLLIEEFRPKMIHWAGTANVTGDALSQLPMLPLGGEAEPLLNRTDEQVDQSLQEILSFYLIDNSAFPLNFQDIKEKQESSAALQELRQDKGKYTTQDINRTQLLCRKFPEDQFRIVLPPSMVMPVVEWYHKVTGHAGMTRLYKTIGTHFHFPAMKEIMEKYVRGCDACQRNKTPGPGQGQVPPREDMTEPWSHVAVNLIGPWSIQIPALGASIEIFALTCIDLATTICELVRLDNKTSKHAALKFETTWLSRYPKCQDCLHDPGPEFTGQPFQECLINNGINARPTTTKNPQSNAIVERMHRAIGDMLRIWLRRDPPETVEEACDLVDAVLASAQRVLRITVHNTLRVSPGTLEFHRDMLLPIQVAAEYQMKRQRRQRLIDSNVTQENVCCHTHDYVAGDKVLILAYKPSKLEARTTGPFVVTQVHMNGTVTIARSPTVFERINIRRLKPYVGREE